MNKIEEAAGLLHGFVNAYEVLQYNINPDLIERAKKYLAGLKNTLPTIGYNLAQEEIERLKEFIEDTFWERHDRNSIADAEAWQEFKTENNL